MKTTLMSNTLSTKAAFRSNTTTTPLKAETTTPKTAKSSNAGLVAGASVVGAIFVLVVSIVIYMCCCRCKRDFPRKNSTYQMYSEVDASQYVVPGNLRTINSPIYGKEDNDRQVARSREINIEENGDIYEEYGDSKENPTEDTDQNKDRQLYTL